MKNAVRFIALGVAGAIAFLPLSPARVDAAQSRGAERVVEEALYDMSGSFYTFACSDDGEALPQDEGEPIEIEGHIYERISVLYDGKGEFHYNLNTMPVGLRGVGVSSGEEFRVRESDLIIANQRLEGGTGRFREQLKLVGRDTHRTFILVASGHYLIAADGTVKTSRESFSTECR
jgi:hypothetical protein